jgi:hypothetical protein
MWKDEVVSLKGLSQFWPEGQWKITETLSMTDFQL